MLLVPGSWFLVLGVVWFVVAGCWFACRVGGWVVVNEWSFVDVPRCRRVTRLWCGLAR